MSFDQLKPFTSTLIAGLLGVQIAFNAAPCLADHCLAQSQALMREKEAALAEYVSSAKAQDAARIEPRVDARQLQEAADEQAGADQ